MEMFDTKTPPKNRHHRHTRDNPSFSSTLLDSIYRSIDEPNAAGGEVSRREIQQNLIFYQETMRKKQSAAVTTTSGRRASGGGAFREEQEHEIMSLRRACLIEKWMEKKGTEKSAPARRNSMADLDTKKASYSRNEFLLNSNSSSSSSDSSGFSSSESESVYGSKSRSNASCYSMNRPKPIRTSISAEKVRFDDRKHENSFSVKTKSKALKIYGDLKKVRQPISPGGRLASFLNSLFNAGHLKKPKIDDGLGAQRKTSYDFGVERNSSLKHGSNPSSTCSSASSFSRSCLRKTPLSRGEFSSITGNGDAAKRSVRFCPVSVIVDEDSRPCGQKTLLEAERVLAAEKPSRNEELECCAMDEDDDDDDAESYASSDLFELDTAGVEERYREELPVYETTFFDRNRAIANGLMV